MWCISILSYDYDAVPNTPPKVIAVFNSRDEVERYVGNSVLSDMYSPPYEKDDDTIRELYQPVFSKSSPVRVRRR